MHHPTYLVWIITPNQGAGIHAALGSYQEALELIRSDCHGALDQGEHCAIQRVDFDAAAAEIILPTVKAEPQKQSGDIAMSGGHVFRWMLQGDRPAEIYGWLEKDHSLVLGSGGFWRTPEPLEAAKRAAAAFNLELNQE